MKKIMGLIFSKLINKISEESYIKTTNQNLILPYYHSVTNLPRVHQKNIGYYRTENNFEQDLQYFTSKYESVELNQINSIKTPHFHISFDDGMSEIYFNALPLLLKYNLNASIFINTDFVDNKKLFYRHKISLILEEISNSTFSSNVLCTFLNKEMKEVGFFINNLTDEFEINTILDLLKIDCEEYLLNNKPYLTTKHLIEMKKLGIVIGNHSKSHTRFSKLNFEEQKNQITLANDWLINNLDIHEFYFSFPFGDYGVSKILFEHIFNELKILKTFGVSGLKIDEFSNHFHRIDMEENNLSAESIIKREYCYFLIKKIFNKNHIKRSY